MNNQDNSSDPVVALANRLRMLQVDFADQDEKVRQEYLTEEVRRALGAVSPNERAGFMEALQAYFPTWDRNVEVTHASTGKSLFDEKDLKDPSFLLGRLIDVCKSLPDAQKRMVADRLTEAGIVSPVGAPDWPLVALTDAKAKLQLSANDHFNAGRVLELLSQLVDFVFSLDRIAWLTWRAIAPNSTIRRPASLQNTVGRFSTGDSAIGRDQLANELKALRQMTAALVGALGQTGRFAAQYFRSISPEEIQMLVGPRNALIRETAFWRKYVELAGSTDSGNIEDTIRAALASFVEAQINGAR